jgi:protein-histidine pros-kinase
MLMLMGIGIAFVIALEATKKAILSLAETERIAMRPIKQRETKLRRPAGQPRLQQPSAAEILFRGLIEAAPDAIVIVSRAGFITLINHQVEVLFGYAQDELLGQSLEILLPARLRAVHHDHFALYAANPHTRPMGAGRELVGRRKDNTEFPVEISLSALETAGDILIISIIRDISAQKHMEAQHQQLLDREQAARAIAEAAVRTRDELLAMFSHDLKNPVAVIKGYAQFLQRRVAKAGMAVDELIVQSLKMIDAETTQLTSQIDELLDMARIQSGRAIELRRSYSDLVVLTRNLAAAYQQTTVHHRIQIDTAVPNLIGLWDASRLERVFGNLLANALKYSPQQSTILLTVEQELAENSAWAVVKVCDQGIGIPAKDLPFIFEQFYRASNVDEQVRGTGLGLASSRRIVEQHGGTIAVASEEAGGSTFTVRLPLSHTL